MKVYEACERIWEGYKLYAGTAFVMRKGVELVGLTARTEAMLDVAETFERRGESIMEHQARTAWLYSALASNFPDGFSTHHMMLTDAWQTIAVAIGHDVGEIAIGDIPDDGNPLHDQKDAAELEMFEKLLCAYAPRDRGDLYMAFKNFQAKDSLRGKALHAVDKVEAVLHLLYLEFYDHYGVMDLKPFVTDSDRRFMRFAGSNCTTDCWAAHVKYMIRNYPENIRGPVLGLMDVAVRDVRGEAFEWWEKDISLV